jgi:hypothetical protein
MGSVDGHTNVHYARIKKTLESKARHGHLISITFNAETHSKALTALGILVRWVPALEIATATENIGMISFISLSESIVVTSGRLPWSWNDFPSEIGPCPTTRGLMFFNDRLYLWSIYVYLTNDPPSAT